MRFCFVLTLVVLAYFPTFADVLAPERDVKFEVKEEGSKYNFIMRDNTGAIRWESRSFGKDGLEWNGSGPLLPKNIAEDLTIAISSGAVSVWNMNGKFILGDPTSGTELNLTTDKLKLSSTYLGNRKSSAFTILDKYREDIRALKGQLYNCENQSRKTTSPATRSSQ